jgi:uncharacterized membrane protein HdeD (DUF308 family)
MTDIAQTSGLQFRSLSAKWGWFVALGIGMILAGGLALGDTVLVTLVSVIFIGAMMVVAGAFQILHAFAIKQWGAFLFALLCGALYVAAGLIIMREPVQGSIIITIFLLAVLSVAGILRIVMALRHREIQGWWLLLLTGIISIGLAVLLYLGLPWSSLWLLGTIIAIELVLQGVAWIRLSFALRGMR